jgi:hypothetical protein
MKGCAGILNSERFTRLQAAITLFSRACFQEMPFAIGQAGWDNWMFFRRARRSGW